MHQLKIRAMAADGNLSAMYEVADAVRRSKDAAPDQIEAASAAQRSIATAMKAHTDMRLQVAQARFSKLLALL